MGNQALTQQIETPHVVVIGGGKMGEAILGGWLASSEPAALPLTEDSFVVVNPGQERRAYLTDTYQVSCVQDSSEIQQADLVVLAVKPQVMMDVLQVVSETPAFQGGQIGPLFVSIAAGLPTARLEEALPPQARLVRVMPNTPLLISAGATTLTPGSHASEDDLAYVRDLFSCLGLAVVVDEDQMDATGAISGSGPAYVAAMIEALRHAGEAQGLDAQVAEDLALQTVLGTARLIREKGMTPEECRIAVCSPKGTTLAALDAMAAAGFDQVFQAGVDAAVARSKELASC